MKISREQQLAEKIYEALHEYLQDDDRRKLKKVIIKCGTLDAFNVETLNACWQQIAAGPVYRNSHIEVCYHTAAAKCLHCDLTFELGDDTSLCPSCRCEQFKIVHKPPTIETFEFFELESE